MKKYVKPSIKAICANTYSVICASEKIGIGDMVEDGTLDADGKSRDDSWSDFGSEF